MGSGLGWRKLNIEYAIPVGTPTHLAGLSVKSWGFSALTGSVLSSGRIWSSDLSREKKSFELSCEEGSSELSCDKGSSELSCDKGSSELSWKESLSVAA